MFDREQNAHLWTSISVHLWTAKWRVSPFRAGIIGFDLPGHQLCSTLGNEVELARRLQVIRHW
jgi:hypothetical protein